MATGAGSETPNVPSFPDKVSESGEKISYHAKGIQELTTMSPGEIPRHDTALRQL